MNSILETSDLKRLKKAIRGAVSDHAWLAIIGDAGSGKTTAVNTVLADMPTVAAIQPPCLRAEKIDIGYVLSWCVWGLQQHGQGEGENPRRSLAAREVQACRFLGEAAQGREVVIVLEESQRLHWRTMTSLKRMREMSFAGQSPLFTLILVGQPELRQRLAIRREVNYRCQRLDVRGLSPSEFAVYADMEGWGKLATPDALDRLEQLTWDDQNGRSYIHVQAKLDDASHLANVRGHKRIEVGDVDDVFTSLVARRVKVGMTYGRLGKLIGEPKSSVHAALEAGVGPVFEKAREAIEKAERKTA